MSRRDLDRWARLDPKIYQDRRWFECSAAGRLLYLAGVAIAKDCDQAGRVPVLVMKGAMLGAMTSEEVDFGAEELISNGLWQQDENCYVDVTFTIRNTATPSSADDGWVYVMANDVEVGPFKVGRTREPEKRRAEIQRMNGSEVHLLRTWQSDDYTKAETAMHRALAKHRQQGEWFDCPLALIDAAASTLRLCGAVA